MREEESGRGVWKALRESGSGRERRRGARRGKAEVSGAAAGTHGRNAGQPPRPARRAPPARPPRPFSSSPLSSPRLPAGGTMVDRGPLLTSAIIFYLSIGAAIFEVLEEPHWRSATDDYKRQKTELLKQFPCLGQEGLDKILQVPGWRPGGSRCRRAPRGGTGTGSGAGSRAGAVPGSPGRASGGPVPAEPGASSRKAPSPGGPRSGRGGSPRFAASPAPRCSLRLLAHPEGLPPSCVRRGR